MTEYEVIRSHGDFTVGDIRKAEPHEVAHLVGKCLVKMASKPKNKMAMAGKNKAAK